MDGAGAQSDRPRAMSRPNLLQYLSERVGLGGDEGRDLRVDHGPDGAPVLADVIRLGWQAQPARPRAGWGRQAGLALKARWGGGTGGVARLVGRWAW